jgi:hypothetical protein
LIDAAVAAAAITAVNQEQVAIDAAVAAAAITAVNRRQVEVNAAIAAAAITGANRQQGLVDEAAAAAAITSANPALNHGLIGRSGGVGRRIVTSLRTFKANIIDTKGLGLIADVKVVGGRR